MKNIFNKTNAPYLAVGVLTTLTLLASGVFAVAPYIGFLAPVAALSVGLPFIIGGAIISAVAIALSAVVISKNNTISQQEKFESRVAQRKQEEENGRVELKASGSLPDVIALPDKDTKVSSPENQQDYDASSGDEKDTEISSSENEPAKEENGQGWGAWGKAKLVAGVGLCGAALYCAAPYIPTVLNGVVPSSVGSEYGHTNSTM